MIIIRIAFVFLLYVLYLLWVWRGIHKKLPTPPIVPMPPAETRPYHYGYRGER